MADTQWVVGDDITGGAKEVAKARVERSSTPLSWPGSDAFPRKLGRMEWDLVMAHPPIKDERLGQQQS